MTAEALFWVIVMGYGTGRERTIATLRSVYQKITGHEIEERASMTGSTGG